MIRFAIPFLCLVSSGSPLWASDLDAGEFELVPLTVSGDRQWAGEGIDSPLSPYWDRAELGRSIPLTVDSILADDPAFSLYRRESGAFAHPTTQGANVRGLGANAAARTLVLRDGIPQNDPFGGWTPWTRFEPIGLARVEIMPSTRSAAWGNLSAGGVVSMSSPSVFEDHQRYQVSGGNLGYRDASLLRGVTTSNWGVAVGGRILRRDGDYLVHEGDRGAIDRRADLEAESLTVRGGWRPHDDFTVEPTWSYFDEERGNGSPLARNRMRGWDASVRATGQSGAWHWQAVAFHQKRQSSNRFTALNDDRTGETPVLDQFDIPGEGTGGSFLAGIQPGRNWKMIFGVDTLQLEGRTNENYGFGLNNRRVAGGRQNLSGIFGKSLWELTRDQRLEATLRMDRWELFDGFLREGPLAADTPNVDAAFEDRDGFEPSAALRWEWQFDSRWHLQLGAAHAFRLPTINELYRPYRVGSDIFDANPRLEPEQFTTIEVAVAGELDEALHVETGLFVSRVENVIANVFIHSGPGESPGGMIPPGGSYNRRENVDTSRVWGWQNRVAWTPIARITITLRHRWLQSTFRESDLQPALEGKRFPQVARHQGNVELQYRPADRWMLFGIVRGGSALYDDPLNRRRIKGYTRTDVGFAWNFHPDWALVGRVENLWDDQILTGVASDGERAIATGRAAWLTLRADF